MNMACDGVQPLSAGDVYEAFIDQLAAAEAVRRDSLRSRGMTVITSAGAVGALFFGFVSTFQASGRRLAPAAHGLVFGTVALFAVAAACGVVSNFAGLHTDVDLSSLGDRVRACPAGVAEAATRDVTQRKLALLGHAQRHNKWRSWTVSAALAMEASAALLLAWAVVDALRFHPQ